MHAHIILKSKHNPQLSSVRLNQGRTQTDANASVKNSQAQKIKYKIGNKQDLISS